MKLVYTTDQIPGYRRVSRGKGFAFILPDGNVLNDKVERQRILSLAIPPAYHHVWVCINPNGHLQATGIDARGRKQYRYHPAWHESAGDRKFEVLTDFAAALPRIRTCLKRDMARPDLAKQRVVAGVVALLDLTGYRIGNTRYEKDNRTFGLSSLLLRHLKQTGDQLRLKFRGKSGHEHECEISHPRLTRLISELQELPGQHLFCYEDETGITHDITTSDVNDWIKDAGGGEFTAKQFRTWKATLLCARELAKEPPPPVKTAQERVVREAIKATALQLNHTATTCRKYYIHPTLIQAYMSGQLYQVMQATPPRLKKSNASSGLLADERRVFKILSNALSSSSR